VADVRAKAELYCAEAGVTLGDLETLSENSYGGGRQVRAAAMAPKMAMEAFGGADDDGTNVEAGETSVTMNIQVEWGIHGLRPMG
tara:strand:+ start:4009 stop:4263 length:255 start_codon:yes stop_codon:yes gene_type:complete